jgi:hypothetical protein
VFRGVRVRAFPPRLPLQNHYQQICNDAGGCHGCQIKRCRKAGAGLPIRFQQTADNTGTITLVRIGKAEILKILHSNSSHIIILNNIIQK